MKNIIDRTHRFVLKELAKDRDLIAVGDDFGSIVTELLGISKSITIYSENSKARMKMRQNFKSEEITYATFFDLAFVTEGVYLLNSYDADKYVELFGDRFRQCEVLVIPYFHVNDALLDKMADLRTSFNHVYHYELEVQKEFATLELISGDVSEGETGLMVFSKEKRNLQNQYQHFDSSNEATLKEKVMSLQGTIEGQQDSIDFLIQRIGHLSSGRYQLLGPLRAMKKLLVAIFSKVPIAREMIKFLRIVKTNGLKVAVSRVKSYFGIKQFRDQYENNFVFREKEYIPFDSEYQENIDFSDKTTDIKMLAFYLPQFHSFKENDEWWGEGFTEWNNTTVCAPRFEGHYQPRTPHRDIGYYDLANIETLRHQAELAKQHGIYGFCFYYYWFSGKRLMEKPVDMLLEHPEIEFPFCLCWANENWTRAWDGQNRSVLIAQDYSDEDDLRFMADLKKYIDDKRYIRIDGKPLVIVYNPGQIPDCEKSFRTWREEARKLGIGEILIWTCQTANNTAASLHIEDYIDAEVEFPPHNTWFSDFAIKDMELRGKSATIINYQKLVEGWTQIYQAKKDEQTQKPVHRACMMAWDNAARRKDNWFTYNCFSLKSLYDWVLLISGQARRDFSENERFVFVNAWNEWAEGTYLEPDERFGYANINTVSKALFGLPFKDDFYVLKETSPSLKKLQPRFKIAVQVHMFYTETIDEIISNLNLIPYEFDCFVSTDTESKAVVIRTAFENECKCGKVIVELFKNQGRDVAPFVIQMQQYIDDYDYVCHIHSKKTVTGTYGDDWRKYIFKHMFGNEEYLRRIFALFEADLNLGLVFPETFPPLEYQAEWGGNYWGVKKILEKANVFCDLPQEPVFPVGNMFWARTEAIRSIIKLGLHTEDFSNEAGQTNLTLAHCIERCWVYAAKDYGFKYLKVFNDCVDVSLPEQKRIAFYVHYNKEGGVSCEDIVSLKAYSKSFEKLVVISNSPLSEADFCQLEAITDTIYLRENVGFDFAAWKYGLETFGYQNLGQYEQVALINNSTLPPVFDLAEMFAEMKTRDNDFWGITLFPYMKHGNYVGRKSIPEHLQSYFIVFNKSIIDSGKIQEFFDQIQCANSYKDAIANGEIVLTEFFKKQGFSYSPYLLETGYICQYLNSMSVPYEKPSSLLLLGSPMVKKKAYDYMRPAEKQKLEYLLSKFKG